MIPYGRQNINQADIDAVVKTLKSDFLTQGPAIPAFEAALATKVGAKHAVAVNSATSALHIAVAALDLGPGDLLWTSPITFVASANCARYCGADVDFVDIDADTFNMCPDALAAKLKQADQSDRLPKVIVPVHMCGQSPNMKRISQLARQYGIRIVEDASHAVGASYDGAPVGSSRFSDITVFSFHPVKIITSGEGGVALTNDADLASRLERLRSHGITRDPQMMTGPSEGGWYYQQLELGWNYRMTDIQATLVHSQLDRLDEFVTRRNVLAEKYDELLGETPLVLPHREPLAHSSFHLYVVRLPEPDPDRHQEIFAHLRASGIGVNVHYIPVHLQPYYASMGFRPGDFPASESYYQRSISIPLYPDLTQDDQDHVAMMLKTALAI
ncbi:MAG: UDP-4-amino-4,6-dideoxy-N-acetyl-beta-L-altrosamine transaminase [Roseobacter sp.]